MTDAGRYVAWLERHLRAVFGVAAAVLVASTYLVAFHLPIHADFSNLLPEDAPSVRDMRRLEERMPAKDSTLILLVAPDPATRVRAHADLVAGLREIGPALIERLEIDDAETRAFFRAHRFLYIPLPDLVAARDALARRLSGAKLRANPLYIDLDDPAPATAPARPDELAGLRAKRREAEARLDRSSHVSADGRTALVVIRTAFRATEVVRDRELVDRFDAVFARVRAAHPGVELGLAGGVPSAVAEHDAVSRGIVLSSIITAVLVGLVLLVHLRGVRLLGLLALQTIVATVASFGLAAITVGHLNAATAFLGAIIAGNGINYGILLIARYLEERRGTDAHDALSRAIAGTLRPTLVASLAASIAYGALAMTRFKGFADFAIIGGLGMLVCWIAAYTLLPALLLRFARAPRLGSRPPIFGRIVVAALGTRRPALVCAIGAAATLAAGVVTWRFIAADPFEYDMRRLRSDTAATVESRRWMAISNLAFGHGVVGRTYLAVDRPAEVAELVAAIHHQQAHTPEGRATIGRVQSILEAVPPDQDARLAVLAELRRLLDDPALDALDEPERGELRALRPPDDLRAITTADLPAELTEQLREVDGRVGLVVAVRPAPGFDDWDGHAMIEFAAAMHRLRVGGATVTASGSSMVLADILAINRSDGPLVTATAALGLVIMVLALVGWNRRSAAVLAGTACGSLGMVAICALIGLKINFLDFVALPIALGLGIDYAINVAHRAEGDPLVTLRTTGGTVFVCSLTTMIGYASLLVSANQAIRDFGVASLIGEITCVLAALTLVPALVTLRPR